MILNIAKIYASQQLISNEKNYMAERRYNEIKKFNFKNLFDLFVIHCCH